MKFIRNHPNDFLRLFRWCEFCGAEIDHLPANAKYCDRECYTRAHIRRATERHRDALRVARRGRTCASCGADISERSTAAKYCSIRCGEIARGQRLPAPLPMRACALPECGKTFQPHKEGQRCCSELHGKRLYNRESRADGRQKPQPWSDKRRDRYHRRRALKKAASTGDPVLLAEIAERDRWRCHICRTRVGKKVAWPHPRSASLDHLVPISELGAHDPTNVRLAHLSCNSSKGNRGGNEQLLLIG